MLTPYNPPHETRLLHKRLFPPHARRCPRCHRRRRLLRCRNPRRQAALVPRPLGSQGSRSHPRPPRPSQFEGQQHQRQLHLRLLAKSPARAVLRAITDLPHPPPAFRPLRDDSQHPAIRPRHWRREHQHHQRQGPPHCPARRRHEAAQGIPQTHPASRRKTQRPHRHRV